MTQNNCDIARDLMPLSVDGVCSEGSQHFLDAHLAQCQPCQAIYAKMKADSPALTPDPTQEEKALQRGIRHLGKRFKALWITIAALVCVVVLVVTAVCVQQAWWNKYEWAPLDTYTVTLYSNDALVSMGLSGSFYEQVYNAFQQDRYYFALEGDDEEHVILTYYISWFPNQQKKIAAALNRSANSSATAAPTLKPFKTSEEDQVMELRNPQWNSDYRFTTMLETQQLCVDNGQLYILDGWDSVETTTGRSMLVAQLGTPVYEVRLSDGNETRTIYYSWKNDVIPNYTADMVDDDGLPLSGILSPSDLAKYKDLIVK